MAGIVHHEDLWRLCRDELTGLDVRTGGCDVRGRWFGVVVGATPRTGELRRGETIPWRVIAARLAPRGRRGPRCQMAPGLTGTNTTDVRAAAGPITRSLGIGVSDSCDVVPLVPPPAGVERGGGG